MMSFEGKTAWITGASSGIGAALAREWASWGANIILSGRDEARLADVAGTLPSIAGIEGGEFTPGGRQSLEF